MPYDPTRPPQGADDPNRENPTRPEEPGSPKAVRRTRGTLATEAGPEHEQRDDGRERGGAGSGAGPAGEGMPGIAQDGVVHQPGRPAESVSGGLGGVQQDDEGGLGGQGLSRDTVNPTGQRDDNQDDLGRDVNDPSRKSTNNRRE